MCTAVDQLVGHTHLAHQLRLVKGVPHSASVLHGGAMILSMMW
jgi:hypothetical protein